MDRILISSCLLGSPVRHDGGHKSVRDPRIEAWAAEGRLVPVCPELEGGLSVPRPAAEIEPGGSGEAVLGGDARVLTNTGADVSGAFRLGATSALSAARAGDCRYALLKENSPSCGSSFVHAGRFDGTKTAGEGVTARLLRNNGIAVFSEHQIDELASLLGDG